MKILIACDKFKAAASAVEVCQELSEGIKSKHPNFECIIHPLADGGNGSIDVVSNILDLKKIYVDTVDPLNRVLKTYYCSDGSTAYIELAKASGIALLNKTELNPLETSTQGTGLLILDAIKKKHQRILLFLGGSCTNDMGIGIAAALGHKFLDHNSTLVVPIGKNLKLINQIIPAQNDFNIEIEILVDVENPLYGPNGAAYIYAKQKGADEVQIAALDAGMRSLARVIKAKRHIDLSEIKGGGSAGGISAGLFGMLENVKIKSGFDLISKLTKLEEKISSVDLVITGEGKMDRQSLESKVIGNISKLAQKYQTPLIAVVGDSDLSEAEKEAFKLKAVHTVMSRANNLEDAILNTSSYLKEIGKSII